MSPADHICRFCGSDGHLADVAEDCPGRDLELEKVTNWIFPIDAKLPFLGAFFEFRVHRDCKRPEDGRIFIQVTYDAECTVSGEDKTWRGRKWYLSEHMTEDEVVKTCFAAFHAAVQHEVMEGFSYNGHRVFNPHASFRSLIEAGKSEIYREAHAP